MSPLARLALVPLLSSAALAGTTPYTFRTLADTSGGFVEIDGRMSMNASGTVAFLASTAGGSAGDDRGIYTSRDGTIVPILVDQYDAVRKRYLRVGDRPSINDAGVVAFGYDGVDGLPRIATSAGVEIARRGSPGVPRSIYQAVINNAGQVAFLGYGLGAGSASQGLYGGSGGAVTTLFQDERAAGTSFLHEGHRLNAGGVALFAATMGDADGLYTVSAAGSPVAVVTTAGPFASVGVGGFDFNDAGAVAFAGTRDLASDGVFVAVDGQVTPRATFGDGPGPRVESTSDVRINNAGRVVFGALVDNGHGTYSDGIFDGADLARDRVVGRGDAMFGSAIESLGASIDLNDAGQIAFTATLAGGRQLLAVATPATPGDATLNGLVNFDDLLILAQHYGRSSGQSWQTGDFNGDAAVGFDDLLALAQRYGSPAALAGDWAQARSRVPEPTTAAATGVAGMIALARRRRVRT